MQLHCFSLRSKLKASRPKWVSSESTKRRITRMSPRHPLPRQKMWVYRETLLSYVLVISLWKHTKRNNSPKRKNVVGFLFYTIKSLISLNLSSKLSFLFTTLFISRLQSIIAVHGLGGHWRTTWTEDNGKLWLRDFLPDQLRDGEINARIMSYGYNSDTAFSKAVTNIDDEAAMLLDRLDGERLLEKEQQRPIILVAHSLGGILAKKVSRKKVWAAAW